MVGVNVAEVGKLVDARMEREEVGEMISRNTIEAHGHFVTTVVYVTEAFPAPEGTGASTIHDVRYAVFVDGKPNSFGLIETVWGD